MVWLGKDISGKPVYTDLARLPHLLISEHHRVGQERLCELYRVVDPPPQPLRSRCG